MRWRPAALHSRQPSPSARLSAPATSFVPTAVVSLAATVLSWRPTWVKVPLGLDPSWQAGLALGFEHHLDWGPQITFTFGPYGFVDTLAPFYRLTALLVVGFGLAVGWGTAALVVSASRPAWGLLPAGALAWAALAIANSHTGFADLSSALAFGLALRALGALGAWDAPPGVPAAGRRAGAGVWPVGLLGLLAGFSLLTKWNDGLVTLGLLAVVVAGFGAAGGLGACFRALGAGAGALAVGFFSAWAGAGQRFADLASYVRGSLSEAAGYSSAMGLSQGRRKEDLAAVVLLGLFGLVLYLAVAGRPPSRRGGTGRHVRSQSWESSPSASRRAAVLVALGLSAAGWAWAVLKEGFVRHDRHDLTYFGLVLVALVLVPVARRYLLVQAGAFAVAAAVACAAAGAPPAQLHSPGATTTAFVDDVRAALGLGGFSREQAELRANLLAAGGSLPTRVLRLIRGHTVAIEPWDDAAAFEYPLRWDPEPVLQAYSAYTRYLDSLDASFLASRSAPQRVVYRPSEVIDGRDPWMDPPATLESMYCHYRQVGSAGAWQVLGLVPSRCGRPHLVGRATARFGQTVAVPREPGEMVLATLSFSLPLRYGVEDVLFRAPAMSLEVWPTSRRRGERPSIYRFIPGTAADFHVFATPSSLGYSAAFTPQAVSRLALLGGGWRKGEGRLVVEFYAVSLRAS